MTLVDTAPDLLPDEDLQMSLDLRAPSARSIELFTGGGGLAIAMHEAGFEHALLNEFDRRACATLVANQAQPIDAEMAAAPKRLADHLERGDQRWPLVEGDVHALDFRAWAGDVDVVAGGVPCQPWSLGGAHKGYEDPRNLWPEFTRAVREVRPRAFLAENVRGLLRPSFAQYWSYSLDALRAPHLVKAGKEDWRAHQERLTYELRATSSDPTTRYRVFVLPVNAADYGVPQVRNRVFTIGIREDLDIDWAWPAPTHSDAALRRDQASGAYWQRHAIAPRAMANPRPSADVLAEDDGLLPWRTVRDALTAHPRLPEPAAERAETPGWVHHVRWPGARVYAGHTPNDLDRPAKTVKAGVHGVPGGETVLRLDDESLRYMTVREVARVMTFPDDWHLSGPRGEQMRQLGNAVPVHLGAVMATAVRNALTHHGEKAR